MPIIGDGVVVEYRRDSGFHFSRHVSDVSGAGLGDCFDVMDNTLNKPIDNIKETKKAVRVSALNLLARREHSRKELSRRLLQKFGEFELVERVLDRLCEESLQSDDRFAEAYVRYRRNAGFGPQRIKLELRERGVADDLSHSYISSVDNDWFDAAVKEQRKKFGDHLVLEAADRAKQTRFLRYRGFSNEQIQHAIDSVAEPAIS